MLLLVDALTTTDRHLTHIEPNDPMPSLNPNQAKFLYFNQDDYQILLLRSPQFDLGRGAIETLHPWRLKSKKEL